MNTLYFVTGNEQKFQEAKMIIPYIERIDLDLPEIQSLNPQDIIKEKLNFALQAQSGKQFVVEDTSLFLSCINDLPGPLIKRFFDALGDEGIFQLTQKYNNNKVRAQTMIGYLDLQKQIHYFESSILGIIVSPSGEKRFAWDRIFKPDGYDKTFAEMGIDEKNNISMRKKSFEQLNVLLSSQ